MSSNGILLPSIEVNFDFFAISENSDFDELQEKTIIARKIKIIFFIFLLI
jgi:hypothetical protein